MKIIIRDNLDRESVADRLVAENADKNYAEFIADKLNDYFGGGGYFSVEQDDYVLWRGMEELI
jgi:hypothetical protein